MKLVQVQLSEDLAEAAQLNRSNPSADAARLLALELFREDKISLGRAAELCETPVEAFMEFAGQRQVPLHYGAAELEADRRTFSQTPHPSSLWPGSGTLIHSTSWTTHPCNL
jgi:predicted HTH domain antitoxin